MSTISRRGFLALGATGAAGVAVAACGAEEDPRGEGRDGELLGAALAAEISLTDSYASALGTVDARDQKVVTQCRDASADRAGELGPLVEDAGGSPTEDSGGVATKGLEGAIAAADLAIAAYREAAGLLSTAELRRTATSSLAQVAGEQGALRTLGGEEPAPQAFVTGLDEPPLGATEEEGS